MSVNGAELFLDNKIIYQPKAWQDGTVQTVLITVPICKSKEARSLDGDVEVRLTFQNETNEKVDIFWLDYDGNPVEYEKELPPGGTYSQDTYETHPWIAKMSCNGAELFLDNKIIYQPKAWQDGAVQAVLITVPVCMSRSLRGDVEVRLTFRNETNEKVDIFWLDYEGNPVEYEKDLPPGGTYSQDTYETHPWIAKMSCSGAELFLDNEKIYQPKARQDGAVQTVLITVPVCKSNEARSLRGDVEVRLTFQNETNGKVDIFWLDYEGNPVEYEKDLPPGGTYSQDTYETHPWIAKMSCSGAELFLDNASIYQPKARQDGAVQTVLITVPVSTCFVDGGHGTSTTVYTTCVHPASVGKES